MSLPEVKIYTDGACLGNPGPGAWAYVMKTMEGELIREDCDGQPETTNNRMELSAVIMALKSLEEAHQVHLISDSQYALKGMKEWMPGWKKRGWRKADKKPVMNVELWKELDELMQIHEIETTWVRGHTGHPENERCDELANTKAHSYL